MKRILDALSHGWRLLAIVALLATSPAQARDARAPDPVDGDAALLQRLGLEESPEPVRLRPGWARPRVVLVSNVSPEQRRALEAVAPGVRLVAVADAAEAARRAADADAVLGPCTREVLEAGPRIRWVQTWYAGVERCVELPAVRERDLLLTNMQRVAGPVMAEHVLAMMLAFARGLDFYVPERLARRWTPQLPATSRMSMLEGRTLLVVGLGGIGSEVARRAHAFGMNVEAIRASSRAPVPGVRTVGLPGELHEFARRADYVVNTTPLTPATRHLYDARFFAALKPGAYFFNVGRGQSVDQQALVDALRSGRLAGAGLDVTDPEPLPPDHPLWTLPNVLLTPHVSGRSDLGDAARFAVARENLRRYVAGERMLSVVDTRSGY